MMIRQFCALCLIALGLAACAPQPPKPAVVYDHMADELQKAASERKRAAGAETALMPPLVVPMPEGAQAESRFDLSVVGAPASQVFMAIVTGTRYTMLVGPEVAGQITVNLKDVTVREALEAIRDLYGYEFQITGSRIHIQPNTLQARVFQINYLASRRQGSSDLRVSAGSIVNSPSATPAAGAGQATPGGSGSGSTSRTVETSRVSMSSDSDFWRDLSQALGAIVGTADGRSVIVNPSSGVVLVKAMPRELRGVEQYLKATQLIAERQVMLEAKILSVTLKEEYQSGVNWASFNRSDSRMTLGSLQPNTSLQPNGVMTTTGVSVIPGEVAGAGIAATTLGKGFFGLAFQTANFAALLNFLETQGSVSVLSSPRISTVNNQKAVLKVGVDEMFITNLTTSSTTDSFGRTTLNPTVTLQPYFSGISLDVTPQIDDEGNIILHVHPAISVVTQQDRDFTLQGTLFSLPVARSEISETDTIVRATDGNIVAIGGLMKQSQDANNTGLPGANRSAAGVLMGQRSGSLTKQELVILLKPTIIRDDAAWAREIEQAGERLRALDPRSSLPTK